MAELQTSRFVPIAGPTSEDWKGTGFRLGPTKVLTAAHVVKNLTSIWVLDPEGSEWADSRAKVIWRSPPDLDVVVLETPLREGHEDWQRILQRPLRRQDRWQTFAYPRARCRPDGRFHLQGSVPNFEATDRRLEITVSEGWPDELERLKGSSGAPVLVRGELCGVLSQGEKAFEGRRLQAIPITAAIDEGLLDHLELPEGFQAAHYFESRVLELMGSDLGSTIATGHDTWKQLWESDPNSKMLARTICRDTAIEVTAVALSDVYCRVFDDRKYNWAAKIYEIFHHALPSAYLRGPQHEISNQEPTEVRIQLATTILAEIANAAIDGRPVQFVESEASMAVRPSHLVALPIETGIDAASDFVRDEVAFDLATRALMMDITSKDQDPLWKFVVELASHRGVPGRSLAPAHVVKDLGRISKGSVEERRGALLGVVRRRLKRGAKNRSRKYYVLAAAGDAEARDFLGMLRDKLPEIRRVVMDGSLEDFDREDEIANAVERVESRRRRKKG